MWVKMDYFYYIFLFDFFYLICILKSRVKKNKSPREYICLTLWKDCKFAEVGGFFTEDFSLFFRWYDFNNLRYADDTTLTSESEEELRSLLMKMKEEYEKAGLKLSIKKLISWHPVSSLYGILMGKQWKQWQILSSWAPKSLQMVTAVK